MSTKGSTLSKNQIFQTENVIVSFNELFTKWSIYLPNIGKAMFQKQEQAWEYIAKEFSSEKESIEYNTANKALSEINETAIKTILENTELQNLINEYKKDSSINPGEIEWLKIGGMQETDHSKTIQLLHQKLQELSENSLVDYNLYFDRNKESILNFEQKLDSFQYIQNFGVLGKDDTGKFPFLDNSEKTISFEDFSNKLKELGYENSSKTWAVTDKDYNYQSGKIESILDELKGKEGSYTLKIYTEWNGEDSPYSYMRLKIEIDAHGITLNKLEFKHGDQYGNNIKDFTIELSSLNDIPQAQSLKYPQPKLFTPTAEETQAAAQRLVQESLNNKTASNSFSKEEVNQALYFLKSNEKAEEYMSYFFSLKETGKQLSEENKKIILESDLKDSQKSLLLTFLNDKNPKKTIKDHFEQTRTEKAKPKEKFQWENKNDVSIAKYKGGVITRKGQTEEDFQFSVDYGLNKKLPADDLESAIKKIDGFVAGKLNL